MMCDLFAMAGRIVTLEVNMPTVDIRLRIDLYRDEEGTAPV